MNVSRCPFGSAFSAIPLVALLTVTHSGFSENSRALNSPRDHLVFLGLDVTVDHEAVVGKVADFSKGTVLVKSPTDMVPIEVKDVKSFTPKFEPKIAKTVLTLNNVKAERTYSPQADPQTQALMMQARLEMYQADAQDRADYAQRQLQNYGSDDSGSTPSPGAGGGGAAGPPAPNAVLSPQEIQAYQNTIRNYDMIQRMDPDLVAQSMARSAEGGYDVLQYTLEVSAPERIVDAYAVIVTSIVSPERPKTPLRVITFADLPTIDSKPRKVTATHNRLPRGFEIGSSDIHIYSLGREIPTNHTNNTVAASWAEARDFLILQRLVSNKHESLPAAVMRQMINSENRAQIPVEQLERTANVKVDRFGGVLDVEFVPKGDPDTDAAIADVVRATPFFPALVDGQPAEGTATVRLSEFVL